MRYGITLSLMIFLLGFGARAEEPVIVKTSPDPAVEKILAGLQPGQSALLPAVKTAGAINEEQKRFGLAKTGPGPRNYCIKWVWAADRKRALFCGGNAGVPHRLNDVWEYDLPSNTWICLWEPDPDLNKARHIKDAEQRKALVDSVAQVNDGVLMTKRGAPFDPVHTWWALTYDPEARAMLWVMGNENKVGYKFKSTWPWGHMKLWAYYPHENRWAFLRSKNCPPCMNASILEYIPELKGSLWFTNTWRGNVTSLYDAKTDAWKELLGKKDVKGNPNCPGSEAVAAYDASRKILVVHVGGNERKGKMVPKRTYHYDVKANTWTKVLESQDGPRGFDSAGPMTWDAVSGLCYINYKGLWAYNPDEKKWTKLSLDGPAAPHGMGCYNPDKNVLMVDGGKGQVWVYRHALKKE